MQKKESQKQMATPKRSFIYNTPNTSQQPNRNQNMGRGRGKPNNAEGQLAGDQSSKYGDFAAKGETKLDKTETNQHSI